MKTLNNKMLIGVLALLLLVYVISRYFRTTKNEHTFRTELVSIDSNKVSTILLYPKAEKGEEIKFTKNGENWTVQKKNLKEEIETSTIKNLLNELYNVKPNSLAAKSPDKWKEFQLNDSLATRVKVIEDDGKQTLDLLIGKFSYQRNNMNGGFQGNNNVNGISYVRLAGEDEIYVVSGFLTFTFNQGFNSFRNSTFVRADKKNVTKISFMYPVDSGFVIEKQNNLWMIAGTNADSVKMETYLNTLSGMNNSSFVDDFTAPTAADYVLTVEGNNMQPLVVKCFKGRKEQEYILNSSLNPKAYYSSDNKGNFASLFKRKEEFFNAEKK